MTRTPRVPFDAYQTPPELCAALMDYLPCDRVVSSIVEPSAGRGNFVRALRRQYSKATITAIDPHEKPDSLVKCGADYQVTGSFERYGLGHEQPYIDLICGNPPYALAEAHIMHALSILGNGGTLAFLLRLSFLESKSRLSFWREHPPEWIYVLAERPSFAHGRTDACAYAFFIWYKGFHSPTTIEVISWKKQNRGANK